MSRWGSVGVGAALFAAALVPLAPAVAGAQQPSSDSLRKQAAEIAAKQDALLNRMNALDEDFNNARLKLADLKKVAVTTNAELKQAQSQYADVQNSMRSYAISNFVSSSNNQIMQGNTINTALVRRTYLESRSGDGQGVADRMRAARADLTDRRQVVTDTTKQIEAEQAKAAKARSDAEKASKELAAQKEKVKGQLAAAVQAEQEARAKAAEEAARREAARQAAADNARRQAAAAQATVSVRKVVRTTNSAGKPVKRVVTVQEPVSNDNTAAQPAPDPTPDPPPQRYSGVVGAAMSRQGMPYSWGADGPGSFDCSGLVIWSFAQVGRGGLPHSSGALYAMGTKISIDQLQPGDLVAYGSPVHHIGIYIGNGQYVHAPHSGDVVKVASIYRSNGAPRASRL